MGRHIIVADVHGCLVELVALLHKLRGPLDGDVLIFVGDLVDKGPESAGVVKLARILREKGHEVVFIEGNHEERHRRWRGHDAVQAKTGKPNPMSRTDEIEQITAGLSEADVAFLDTAVLMYRIPEHDTVVVHGGIMPDLEELPPDGAKLSDFKGKAKKAFGKLLRVRFIDPETGKMRVLGEHLPTDSFWAKIYDGRFGRVVFGHEAFKADEPIKFPHALGIDLGCVLGDKLTALVIHEDGSEEIVSVPAFEAYAGRVVGRLTPEQVV